MIVALLIVGCSSSVKADDSPAINQIEEQTIESAETPIAECEQVVEEIASETILEAEEEIEVYPWDVNGWGWKEEYGYYVVENERWPYLTIWYDTKEKKYSDKRENMHHYSSLSNEHVPNGYIIYPINEPHTNKKGNTFIPFEFTKLKYPEYQDDGDNVYWLLYENPNGQRFLKHYP